MPGATSELTDFDRRFVELWTATNRFGDLVAHVGQHPAGDQLSDHLLAFGVALPDLLAGLADNPSHLLCGEQPPPSGRWLLARLPGELAAVRAAMAKRSHELHHLVALLLSARACATRPVRPTRYCSARPRTAA